MVTMSNYNPYWVTSPSWLYKDIGDYLYVNADPSCKTLSGIREGGGSSVGDIWVFVPDRMPDCYLGKVAYSYLTNIPGAKIGYVSPSGEVRTVNPYHYESLYWGFMDINDVGVWKVGVSLGEGRFAANTISTFTALPSCNSKWALTYFNKYGLISTENRFVKVTETVDYAVDYSLYYDHFFPSMSSRKDTSTLKFASVPLAVEDRDLMIGLGRRPIGVHRADEELGYGDFNVLSGNAMASKAGITLDGDVTPVTFELKGKFDYE